MRALTVRQPYASLIMAGLKPVENRSWPVPSTLPQWRKCPACGVILDPDTPDGYHDPPTASCHYVYNGPFPFRLWIHAGQGRERVWNASEAYEALARATHDEPYEPWMVAATVALMPLGALLGSVLVTGCHHADDCRRPHKPGRYTEAAWLWDHCSEWAEPNAYHWTLADPQPLPEPIPMKGRQGLWTLPDDVAVPA